ncbi:ABC transporter ATP-binding protein [Phormidium pseudopriestleyi FRX01]|uniref:ABC transporter ATP-binding protein n=1 Tax=Phormidium pseudopriestleyi FRX01 TaxID=1759528 RepID=A0ABS3FWI7_9CYAN|nr:ABC transporter ATP-binding protein [Phormidium pseudopriestleyi]MBO0351479.1 ABC transporter ATP-binding protein [Phormidium pseudopriestleyi FRX01]
MSNHSILKAEHLYKMYGQKNLNLVQAVEDVSLELKAGEIVLISGPNGSGKTTLLSLLGCMGKPTEGTIKILDCEVTGLRQTEVTEFRLKNIGFIFQTFRLLNFLTVLENVKLILNLAGKSGVSAHQRANFLLDELNISHRANFFPPALSGGEKQRVAIARALANDPPLLLADEPTGSLDYQTGQSVIQLLSNVAQTHQKAVAIVTHDPRIEHYADRILKMEDGHLTTRE